MLAFTAQVLLQQRFDGELQRSIFGGRPSAEFVMPGKQPILGREQATGRLVGLHDLAEFVEDYRAHQHAVDGGGIQ
ncbi:hypothetical protein D3C76_1109410 [compost metagenome]